MIDQLPIRDNVKRGKIMFSEKRQKQTKNARSIRETQKSFPFQEEGALRRYVLSKSMRNWLIKIDLDGQNTIYSLQGV